MPEGSQLMGQRVSFAKNDLPRTAMRSVAHGEGEEVEAIAGRNREHPYERIDGRLPRPGFQFGQC